MSTNFPNSPSDNPRPKSETAWDSGHSETFRDRPSPLTDVQRRAIDFTVRGYSDTRIAQLLSINRKSLWRWKTEDPDYIDALHAARYEIYAAMVDIHQNVAAKATTALANIVENPAHKDHVRAAAILLQHAARLKPPHPAPLSQDPHDDDDDRWPEPVLGPKVG